MPDGAATVNLYCPKLITVLREGYGAEAFRRDVLAALTVAIVALPLSMAFAIASGVTPERGLYTAIVGGFLVSMLLMPNYSFTSTLNTSENSLDCTFKIYMPACNLSGRPTFSLNELPSTPVRCN